MIEKRIQSLVAARAICDFLKGKDGEQEIKAKVKKYIQSIDLKNGEALVMSKLDELFFDGCFVPFIEEMQYDISPQFTPVKRVFAQMVK